MVDRISPLDSPFRLKKIGSLLLNPSCPLGEGCYGKVYRGHVEDNPLELVAIKQISLEISPAEKDKLDTNIENEISVMEKLKHENIIQFKGLRCTKNNVYIISEYCPDGNLESINSQITTLTQALTCLKQIVDGVLYAHSQNIIHRDIKPANVLLNKGTLKICDFGFARFVDNLFDEKKMTAKGTPNYMAPEVFYGKPYNGKCDVWSIGVLFYELIYKFVPWYGSTVFKLFENIKENKLDLPDINNVDDDVKDLLRKMLTVDPEERLNLQGIFQHKVFKRKIPKTLRL